MGNSHGGSHLVEGDASGTGTPTGSERTESPFKLRPSKLRKKSTTASTTSEGEAPPVKPSGSSFARRVRSFSHVGHASTSSSDAKPPTTDVHTARRANTTNGIRTSPPGMSPSQSKDSFSSLRSSHSFHSFHVPHIKFHSFHGNHEHSKSWQVLEELATQPGFRYDLGQFEQIKQIGSGAFGRVLLCKHKLTGQKVVLKAIEKKHVIRTRQQHHLQEERNALKDLAEHNCPFVVHTVGCFQDEKRIYFVMEYVPGGELFAHLKASNNHHFSEKRTRFYIAEAVLALQHMHEKEHLVYRDIKPENMLLDENGHLKIVDFGFAKHLDTEERTYTFCGTPDYLPPEVVLGKGSGRQADYWALGVLAYELLVGHAPFVTYNGRTGETTYEDILKCQPRFPKWVSPTAKDFIIRLLTRDPDRRLGAKRGMDEIKEHEWFKNVDWDAMLRMEVRPPKLGKCKKGTVNIQPPKPKNARPSEDVQLDDESKELFQSFDFVVRAADSSAGDGHNIGRIEEENEENAAPAGQPAVAATVAAPAAAAATPAEAPPAQFFIDEEESEHESSQ